MRVSDSNITYLKENEIFVFGSNLMGKHETGAAKKAIEFGAEQGKGVGLISRTYALPTVLDKQNGIRELITIGQIQYHVTNFINTAKKNQV